MSKDERLPYNPFPLGVLRATGLSPRAKNIFSILGVHSHFEGYTLVGFNRLVEESGRSRWYVSEAIDELIRKGRIRKKARGRKLRKSDKTTLWLLTEELRAVGVNQEDLGTYPHAPNGFTTESLEEVGSIAYETKARQTCDRSVTEVGNVSTVDRTHKANVSTLAENVSTVSSNVSAVSPIEGTVARQEPSDSKPSVLKPSGEPSDCESDPHGSSFGEEKPKTLASQARPSKVPLKVPEQPSACPDCGKPGRFASLFGFRCKPCWEAHDKENQETLAILRKLEDV